MRGFNGLVENDVLLRKRLSRTPGVAMRSCVLLTSPPRARTMIAVLEISIVKDCGAVICIVVVVTLVGHDCFRSIYSLDW